MKEYLTEDEAEEVATFIEQRSSFAGKVVCLIKSKSIWPWVDEWRVTISGEPLSPAEREQLHLEASQVLEAKTGESLNRICLDYRQPHEDKMPWLLLGWGSFWMRRAMSEFEEAQYSRKLASKGFRRKPILFKKARKSGKE